MAGIGSGKNHSSCILADLKSVLMVAAFETSAAVKRCGVMVT